MPVFVIGLLAFFFFTPCSQTNFKLSEDDMKKIRGLDKEKRFFISTLAEIQHFKDWNPGD